MPPEVVVIVPSGDQFSPRDDATAATRRTVDVLVRDYAPQWASKQGIEDTSLEALAADEKVRAAVQEGVDAANEHLARVEQIKKFTIVPGDWLPGGDELTPTMKLKRKPIADKYRDEIEAMYAK